jgi:hypothetical protein
MPKKPVKWRIKFWVLCRLCFKIHLLFEIYCCKNLEVKVKMGEPCGEASAPYGVVMEMLHGLKRNGHCVVMDN